MACPACGAPVIKSIATRTTGGADMSGEPRTEILRRRIELYLHCIGDGISGAAPSDFVREIAEAEDELLMLTTESIFRDDVAAHGSRQTRPIAPGQAGCWRDLEPASSGCRNAPSRLPAICRPPDRSRRSGRARDLPVE